MVGLLTLAGCQTSPKAADNDNIATISERVFSIKPGDTRAEVQTQLPGFFRSVL